MRKLFGLLVVLLVLSACSKGDNARSGYYIPVKIQRLLGEANCTCDPYIGAYRWNGKLVYTKESGNPFCDGISVYYNENGSRMDMPVNLSYAEFRKEATLLGESWQCR